MGSSSARFNVFADSAYVRGIHKTMPSVSDVCVRRPGETRPEGIVFRQFPAADHLIQFQKFVDDPALSDR